MRVPGLAGTPLRGGAAHPAPQVCTDTQTFAPALDPCGIYLAVPREALDERAQLCLAPGVQGAEPAAPSFLPPRALWPRLGAGEGGSAPISPSSPGPGFLPVQNSNPPL